MLNAARFGRFGHRQIRIPPYEPRARDNWISNPVPFRDEVRQVLFLSHEATVRTIEYYPYPTSRLIFLGRSKARATASRYRGSSKNDCPVSGRLEVDQIMF
jgi:hypothetical protein